MFRFGTAHLDRDIHKCIIMWKNCPPLFHFFFFFFYVETKICEFSHSRYSIWKKKNYISFRRLNRPVCTANMVYSMEVSDGGTIDFLSLSTVIVTVCLHTKRTISYLCTWTFENIGRYSVPYPPERDHRAYTTDLPVRYPSLAATVAIFLTAVVLYVPTSSVCRRSVVTRPDSCEP